MKIPKLFLVSIFLVSLHANLSRGLSSHELEICCAGTFSGSTGCNNCKAGTFSTFGSLNCTACPAGSFSTDGAPQCLKCPAGTFAGTAGSAECTACPIGHFADTPGSIQCSKCPAGSNARTEGSRKCSPSRECSPCLAGTYASAGSSDSCTPCLPGTHSSTNGATRCSQCDLTFAQTRFSGLTQCDYCPDSATTADDGKRCLHKVPVRCSEDGKHGSQSCRKITDDNMDTYGTISAGWSVTLFPKYAEPILSITFWIKEDKYAADIDYPVIYLSDGSWCSLTPAKTKSKIGDKYIRITPSICNINKSTSFGLSSGNPLREIAFREVQMDY